MSTWNDQQHYKSRTAKAAVGSSFTLEPSLWKWRCKLWQKVIKGWCIRNTLPVFTNMHPHAQPAMFRVINPVLNVIKTGFATFSNLLAHRALHLTETDTFVIFLESTPVKWGGKCQYTFNKSANKSQSTMNIYHSPQPQQLANTVWNLSTPIICTCQVPRLPNPGLYQPFGAQRAIEQSHWRTKHAEAF